MRRYGAGLGHWAAMNCLRSVRLGQRPFARHDRRLDRAGWVAFGLARGRTQIAPDDGRTLVDVR
jgi:hypothetical protein